MPEESGGDREIMADMDDATREGNALSNVLVLELLDLLADFINGDVVPASSVWFRESIHEDEVVAVQGVEIKYKSINRHVRPVMAISRCRSVYPSPPIYALSMSHM